MRVKDPTEWMKDLTLFVDDEEIQGTAERLEPDLVYGGSKLGGAIWLSLVGTAAGALAAVTFSAEIRSSIAAFALYLLAALVLFGGLRPATSRMLGKTLVWPAKLAFFWGGVAGLRHGFQRKLHVALAGIRPEHRLRVLHLHVDGFAHPALRQAGGGLDGGDAGIRDARRGYRHVG